MTDNVIPEDEINRRRRTAQLCEDMGDLISDAFERGIELMQLDPDLELMDVWKMVAPHVSISDAIKADDAIRARLGDFMTNIGQMQERGELDPMMNIGMQMGAKLAEGRDPFVVQIDKLFADAPTLEDASGKPVEGQAPAFIAMVVLRSGREMQGAVSKGERGMLKILVAGTNHDRKPIMIEHFFHIGDVEMIAVQREIETGQAASSIWVGSS